MGTPPKASIILPTFNRARTLPRAIATVLGQSEGDLELIVVDDGSTDDTEQLMAAQTDPRIRYLRRNGNGGPAAARNAGLAAARATYVGFQDSDDEWLPLKLEKQISALESAEPDVGLALCGQIRWDTRSVCYLPGYERIGVRQGRVREEILRNNFALTPSWLVRREVFGAIGDFDESLPMLEDWEWMIRYTERFKTVFLDEPLMMVWESLDSISNNHPKYTVALDKIIRRHERALQSDPRSLANLHYVLGKKHALHRLQRDARREFLRAARLWPRDWRPWVTLLLSASGSGAIFRWAWRTTRRLKGFEVPDHP